MFILPDEQIIVKDEPTPYRPITSEIKQMKNTKDNRI